MAVDPTYVFIRPEQVAIEDFYFDFCTFYKWPIFLLNVREIR